MNNYFKKFNLILCLSLTGLFTFSCRIGLGASVDTEPPKISIESPAASAVIRDSFALKGNVSDDKGIKSIEAVFTSTDSKGYSRTFTGDVTDESWKCIISDMPDGSFEVTVTATDHSNHTTTASRQFTIDNTPPLVVLQRPSSKATADNSSTDSYGQLLTLEGQAADDNDVDHIDVSIFKDAAQTQLLKTVTLKNVPPTISLDVAQFVDGVENDYSTIYGTTSKIDDTRYFYLSLKVYDGAKRYPVDGERSADDDNGNATTSYYLYSDLSGSVLSNYKVTDVYHMLSGFYSDSNVSNSVKQQLESVSIKESRFSLNPENSPTYTVTGRSWLTVEKDSEGNISPTDGLDKITKDYYLTNDTAQLVVEVSPGLDGSSILPETIGVYLLKTNNVGEPENNAEKIWIVKPETAWGDYPAETAPLWSDRKSMSGSSYKFSSEKNISAYEYGLKINACYRIYVVGKDNAGNQLDNTDTKFCGFYLASSGATMSYKLMEQEDYVTTQGTKNKVNTILKIRPTDKNKFYAYRMFSSSIPKTISKDMFYYNGTLTTGVTELEIEGIPDSYDGADKSSYSAIYYDNNIPLEYVDDNDKSTVKKYLMYLILDYKLGGTEETDVNLQNTYDSYLAVKIDDSKPTTTIKQPVASYKDDTKYMDDTSFDFRLESKDSDSGIEKLEYVITKSSTAPADGDAAWISTKDYTGGVYDFSRNLIEGENSLAEGKWYLYAKSTDAVGLVSDTVSTWFNVDKAAPALTVSDLTEDSKNLLNQTITIDGNNKYLTITGTIEDSNALHGTESLVIKVDDVDKVSTKIDVANDHTATAQEPWTYTKATKTWTYKLPVGTESGTLKENTDVKLEVIAKDIVNRKVSREFTLYYDTHKPIASISSPDTDYSETQFISADKFDFKISASDSTGSGIKTISYVFSRSSTKEGISESWVDDNSYISGDKYITKTLDSGNGTPSDETKLTEGKWYLYVKATDKVGLTSDTICRAFNVDKAAPELSVKVGDKQLSEDSTNAFYEEISNKGTENEALVLTGTVSDTNALSKLEISVDGQTLDSITPNNGTWEYNLRVGTEDGTLQKDASISVNLTATDAVSRKTSKDYIVYYDTKAPTLDVSSPAENISVDAGAYKIKGNVADDGFGLTTLVFELRERGTNTVLKDENNKDISGTSTYDTTTKKWSGSGNYPLTVRGGQWYFSKIFGSTTESAIPLGTKEGSIDLYVKATEDSAVTLRAKITEKTVPFYFDSALPGVNEDGIQAKGRTTNTNFTLTGKVWDSNEVASVSVSYDENGITKTLTSTGDSPKVTLGSVATAKTEETGAAWSCPFAITSSRSNGKKDGELSDGTYTFTITATDAAGKTATVQRTVTVDTIKPEMGTNIVDGSQGTDINGNYWFSTNQVPILVEGNDSGSGISKAEYSVDNGTSWSTLAANSTGYEGYATCSAQGANAIKVRITDVAGNVFVSPSDITAYIDTKSPVSCTSNITGTKLTNGNNAITVELSDISDDTNSNAEGTFAGIDTTESNNTAVQITKLGTKEVSFKSSYADGKYTITIPTSNLTSEYAGGVVVTVKDKVGNSQTFQIFTLDIDDSKPTVTITKFTDADNSDGDIDVNGTINISGTASDNALSSVKLEYSLNNTSWTEIPEVTGTNNWSVSGIDTKKAFGTVADGTVVYLKATATDAAGNEGESTVREIVVDQRTDKPVVKISSLNSNNSTLMYGDNASINGSVKDDDSSEKEIVKAFVVTSSSVTAANATGLTIAPGTGTNTKYKVLKNNALIDLTLNVPATSKIATYEHTVLNDKKAYDITVFNPVTGDWTFYPFDVSDGSKSMFFFIEDNISTLFYTKSDETLNRPKIQYKTGAVIDSSSETGYKSDTESPNLRGFSIEYYDESVNPPKWEKIDNPGASTIAGGVTRKRIRFTAKASDASGISRMEIVLTAADKSHTKKFETISSNNFTQSYDNSETAWTTSECDISSWKTGSCTAVFTYYDQSGLYNNATYNFVIDNDGPNIKVTNPASGKELTGVISLIGSAIDSGDAGTVNTFWMIPTKKQMVKDNSPSYTANHYVLENGIFRTAVGKTTGDTYSVSSNDWTDDALKEFEFWQGGSSKLDGNGSTVTSWEFELGGSSGNNPSLENFDDSNLYATSVVEGIYTLPVYFKSVDSLGNITLLKNFVIKHNPDGDKPSVEFTYPTASGYDKNDDSSSKGYITLGSTIRVTGSAIVPSGTSSVNSVYLQIASDAGEFNSTDKNKAGTGADNYGYTIVNAYDVLNTVLGRTDDNKYTSSNIPDDIFAKTGFATKTAMNDWWGIKASGSASWNKALNETGSMNPKAGTNSGTNNVKIRACAVNSDGKFGAWSTGDNLISIHIDDKAPVVTVAVNQYTAENVTKIASLNDSEVASAEPVIPSAATQSYESDMFLKGQWYLVLNIVDESDIGSITVTKDANSITHYKHKTEVKDSSNEVVAKGYNVYIPIDKNGNGTSITVTATDLDTGSAPHTTKATYTFKTDNIAPTLTSVKGNNDDISLSNTVSDSNMSYTISADSSDEGSGFERALFYFMRKDGLPSGKTYKSQVLIDPMLSNSKETLESLTTESVQQGENTYDMYGKAVEGKVIGGTFTPTTKADITDNKHIRAGGLIFIEGVYRRISSIESTSGEVTFTPVTSITTQKNTTPTFIYGQVVDNTRVEEVTSKTGTGFTFKSNKPDDGDGMPETISKTSTTWSWDATLHSTNMPDGPVTLVILVFDNAGNVNGTQINTIVSNNAPRIAKISFGTDLDGNSKVENNESGLNEIVTYNILSAEGMEKEKYELDFDAPVSETDSTKKYSAGKFRIKNGLAVVPEFTGGNGEIKLVVKNSFTNQDDKTAAVKGSGTSLIKNTGLASGNTTEKTITGDIAAKLTAEKATNTIYAYNVDTSSINDDDNKALSFTFWDSTDETTCGDNSNNAVLYVKNFIVDQVDDTAPTASINSIEILDKTTGHIDASGSWNSNGDDAVSGVIKISGTAYDETRLGSLNMYIDSYKMGNSAAGTATTEANTAIVEVAAYSAGVWTPKVAGFTVTDNYMNQNGHEVTWTYKWDSSKITGVAKNDIKIHFTAKDAKPNSGNATDKQVDVVPYITGVARNNKYNTNRARSGAYTLRREETANTITGFNLTNLTNLANSSLKITENKDGSGKSYAMTDLAISGSDLTFTVPATAKSGYLHLIINNVAANNNMNAYIDSNTETNAKAYDHNTLTDDRYIHIWRVTSNDTFKGSKNCNYPAMSKNPNDGVLYASFTNYGQSKTYYTNQFTGNTAVGVSDYTGTVDNGRWTNPRYTPDGNIQPSSGVATVFNGYDPPEFTDISVGSDGQVNVFYAANYHGGNDASWNGTSAEDAGGIYVYDSNAPSIFNNRTYHNIYRSELYTYDDELNQFKNIRVNRIVSGTSKYINMVYYDRLRNSIKFAFIPTDSTSKNGYSWVTLDGSYDTVDNGGTGFTFATTWKPFILTDARYSGVSRASGTGESVALTANINGYAVVLYMDADSGQLRIARANSLTPNTVDNWTVQGVFASTDENYDTASDYMSCAVDSEGYLHIAFQNTKGQLVYAKSTNNPSDGNTAYTFGSSEVLDDSGMWIDMTMDGTTPYISYLSRVNSYDGMKIAFYDSNFDENNDGTPDGGWETMTAPLDAKVTNVRSCIEVKAKAQDENEYQAAIGFCPGSDYRAAFFVGK